MPYYTYVCPECGCSTEKPRKVEDRNKPLACPDCKQECIFTPSLSAPRRDHIER